MPELRWVCRALECNDVDCPVSVGEYAITPDIHGLEVKLVRIVSTNLEGKTVDLHLGIVGLPDCKSCLVETRVKIPLEVLVNVNTEGVVRQRVAGNLIG